MNTQDKYQPSSLTLCVVLAARQGRFARSARVEQTTSAFIPFSTCSQKIQPTYIKFSNGTDNIHNLHTYRMKHNKGKTNCLAKYHPYFSVTEY